MVVSRVCAGATGAHHVDLCVSVARAAEHDLRAVRRPGGLGVRGRVGREAGLHRAALSHRVDLVVAVAVAAKRDALPVRGPGRLMVLAGIRRSGLSVPTRRHSSRRSRDCRRGRTRTGSGRRPGTRRAHRRCRRVVSLRLAAAIRVHDVDLPVAVAVAAERDPLSVGDQVGCVSVPARLVSRVWPLPSAFMT